MYIYSDAFSYIYYISIIWQRAVWHRYYNINREVKNSDRAQKRGGNVEGTWQEHDGTDGQTDDYKVSNRTLLPTFQY